MSITSQLPILSILQADANNATGSDATGADAANTFDLGLGQPTAPLLDLGGDSSSLTVDLPILNPVLDALSADVDLNVSLGGSDPLISIGPAAPATGSSPDASPSPGGSLLPSLPSVDLDIDLGLGGGTGSTPPPSTGVDPDPVGPIGSEPTVPGGIPSGPIDTGTNPGTGPTTGGVPVGGASGGSLPDGSFGGLSMAESIDWSHRDLLEGNGGDNRLMGLNGNDTIHGYGGNDVIFGNQNDDRLFGGLGDDTLHGGRDNDFVSGDEGDDELWGEFGNDTFEGGAGADMFCFGGQTDNDLILDFNAAEGDRLNFYGQDYAFHEMGGSAVITLSGGGTVMLNGVSTANLDNYILG